MERTNCYWEGYRAASKGKNIDSCRYSENTEQYGEWIDGFYEYQDDMNSDVEQRYMNDHARDEARWLKQTLRNNDSNV